MSRMIVSRSAMSRTSVSISSRGSPVNSRILLTIPSHQASSAFTPRPAGGSSAGGSRSPVTLRPPSSGRPRRLVPARAAIAALAGTNLRGLPDDGGLSVTGDRDPPADEPPAGRGVNAEDAWWDGMVNRIRLFTGDPRELIDTLVRDMADRLTIILDIYAPDAETLLGADPAP